MTEQELEQVLMDLFWEAEDEGEFPELQGCESYEEAMLCTTDNGIVLTLEDEDGGQAEFQLTIRRVT